MSRQEGWPDMPFTGSSPVLIEWLDSAQPIPGWRLLSDLPNPDVVKCESVGWIIGETDDVLMLAPNIGDRGGDRSEEHTSELQSLMRISYAVFCLKKKKRYFANRSIMLYNVQNTSVVHSLYPTTHYVHIMYLQIITTHWTR